MFALVLSVAFIGCTKADPIDETLGKVIAAYGGKKNLEKLKSYRQIWAIKSMMGGAAGSESRFVDGDKRLRVEVVYPKSAEIRLIDGERGFRVSNAGMVDAKGPSLFAMKLQRLRVSSLLYLLEKKQFLTLSEVEGFTVLSFKEGELTGNYYINPKTFMIEKFSGSFMMGDRQMEFIAQYSEFKEVDGVVMPHKELKSAMGITTAEMTLRLTEFVEHGDDIFKLQ
ncbi:MAG: hypothetical protein KAR06_05105 [Deltaproteobacteria bacterium]|nr:hypothetical protein [Deltaproteobacteria bacterium]